MNSNWNGYFCIELKFEEHDAIIVCPRKGNENGSLAVKTEYWGAFAENAEIPFLQAGYHVCYIKNDNRFGTDGDLDRKARFIRYVQHEFGLKIKCVPIGMSCGGLIAVKLAARYPELVGCLYLDAPVINYMSWPCGFGIATNVPENHSEIMGALNLKDMGELLAYRDMPLDKIPVLVANRIPVVMVTGDSDQTVPYCENGVLLEKAYREVGLEIAVYVKPGGDHHPHGLSDPKAVLDFIGQYV